MILADGVVEDYDYDSLNRLELLTVWKDSTYKLFTQDYTLLVNGQRDYVIEERYDGSSQSPFSTVKIDWGYDALNRLVSEVRNKNNDTTQDTDDYFTTFSLDLVGNRLNERAGWDDDTDGTLESNELDRATVCTNNDRDQLLKEELDSDGNGDTDSVTKKELSHEKGT